MRRGRGLEVEEGEEEEDEEQGEAHQEETTVRNIRVAP